MPNVGQNLQPFIRQPVCQSVSLSACPSVGESVSQFFRQAISQSISLSVSPSVHQAVRPSVRLSVRQYISFSVSPSVRPSVSPSISLSVSPSVSPSLSQSFIQSASQSWFVFSCFIFVSTIPLKPFSRIWWNFVVVKDILGRWAYLQEILINFVSGNYPPFELRNLYTNETVRQRNVSENLTTEFR